jgi:ANTAR domain/PAS fold
MASPALPRHRLADRPVHAAASAPRPAAERPAAPMRTTGRYRYDQGSGTWWWSPEMFAVHGLPPGSPQPDTELVLGCQRPEDRPRVREAVSEACATGRPFTLETRVVRPDGLERAVVLTGEAELDGAAAVAAVQGWCADITDCRPPGSDGERAQALEAEVGQLRAAMASRAAIEQAKGILMLLTTCSDQVAFDLLAHISSHTHRKVRDVALAITRSASGHGRLPDDVRDIIRDACPPAPPTS